MYDITSILIELVWIFLFTRTIVCFWMIFDKAWRHWWEALIPIWNIYVYFKIAGRKNWFWALFITPILWIIASLIFWFISNPTMYSVRADSWDLDSVEQSQVYSWEDPWIAGSTEVALTNCWGRYDNCGGFYARPSKFQVIKNAVNWFLGILTLILPLVANILVQFWLAKKFGKWVGFWFWLLFLNPIFIGILAFDDSTYNANNTKKSE
jgi:hypothetical protein